MATFIVLDGVRINIDHVTTYEWIIVNDYTKPVGEKPDDLFGPQTIFDTKRVLRVSINVPTADYGVICRDFEDTEDNRRTIDLIDSTMVRRPGPAVGGI